MEKLFDGKKQARLGTAKNPARISVQTEKKRKEMQAECAANGWHCDIDLAPDKPENLTDWEILSHPIKTRVAEDKVGRNDPCPCGSGKKYKKCCGQ